MTLKHHYLPRLSRRPHNLGGWSNEKNTNPFYATWAANDQAER